MEIEKIIAHSIERIIEYANGNKRKKDDFHDGVGLGIYVVLSALQSDIKTYSNDKDILERLGLNVDLDKLNL